MSRLNNMKIIRLVWGLTLLLLVVAGVTGGSSILTVRNSENINTSWQRFEQQTVEKHELLGHMREALGYGGMIHQFKNYILRQDAPRIEKFNAAAARVEHAIANYEALEVTAQEKAALQDVGAMLDKYVAASRTAVKLVAANATAHEIDAVVKIDDGPALHALDVLGLRIDAERTEMSANVSHAVQILERTTKISLVLVLALILVLGGSFFWLSRWRIVLPLEFLSGVIATLAKGEKGVEVPYTARKDEIGELARSVAKVNALARSSLTKGAALDAAKVGTILIDSEFNVTYANAAMIEAVGQTEDYWQKLIPGFSAQNLVGTNIDVFHRNAQATRAKIDSIAGDNNHKIEFGGFVADISVSSVVDADGTEMGHVMQWFDKTAENNIGEQISKVIGAARQGDFSGRVDTLDSGSLLTLSAGGINDLNTEIGAFLQDIDQTLSGLSQGDLTSSVKNKYGGQLGDIAASVNRMAENTDQLVSKITASTSNISSTSEQILSGATALSARAERQAASLEETAAAMEEISATVNANVGNAVQANSLAEKTRSQAEKGREVVAKTVVAMKEIRESSTEIGDIVATIEAIAFQTNLLALNAAVEAARAGDAGKGFAVVASEVRALAQRSGDAAKTIKNLITTSSDKVEEGDRLVGETDVALSEILDGVLDVARTVEDITEASKEQAVGVDEVTTTVSQLDEITQKNATLADRSADASRNLSQQASILVGLVGNFSLRQSPTARSGENLNREIRTWDADARASDEGQAPTNNHHTPALDVAGSWSEF